MPSWPGYGPGEGPGQSPYPAFQPRLLPAPPGWGRFHQLAGFRRHFAFISESVTLIALFFPSNLSADISLIPIPGKSESFAVSSVFLSLTRSTQPWSPLSTISRWCFNISLPHVCQRLSFQASFSLPPMTSNFFFFNLASLPR